MYSILLSLLFYWVKLRPSLSPFILSACLLLFTIERKYTVSFKYPIISKAKLYFKGFFISSLFRLDNNIQITRNITSLGIVNILTYFQVIYLLLFEITRFPEYLQLQPSVVLISSIALLIIFYQLPFWLSATNSIFCHLSHISRFILAISILLIPIPSLWDQGRYSGPFISNAAFTQFLVIFIFLHLHRIFKQRKNSATGIGNLSRDLIPILATIFLMLMSGSRSSTICGLIILLVLILKFFYTWVRDNQKFIYVAFLISISCVSAAILFGFVEHSPLIVNGIANLMPRESLPNPFFDRYQQWSRFYHLLPTLPIFGLSPSYRFFTCNYDIHCIGYDVFTTDPHNLYLNTLISFGPFFTIAFFAYILYIYIMALRLNTANRDSYSASLFILFFLLFFSFGGGTLFSFNSLFDRFFFLCLSHILFLSSAIHRCKTHPEESNQTSDTVIK